MKVPTATKLPSGAYRVRVTINGKRQSFTKEKKEDAVNSALLAMLSNDPDAQERQERLSKITIRSAINDFLEKRGNVLSPSTIRAYTSIMNNRFQAVMDLPLNAKIDWQSVVNSEAKEISAKTLKNCWGLIKGVLTDYGVEVGSVRLPQVVVNRRPFLEPHQMIRFVEEIKGHKYELPYLLCLHGLRRSEMMALKKEDIYNDLIHVHGAVVQDVGGEYVYKKENKNTSSNRNVPVMIPRVKKLAKASETDILCPWHPSTITKPLSTIMKRLGFPDVGLHGLRRSYASLCYHCNVSEAQTMEWGGWSDISTMRKVYIQIAEADRVKKSQALKDFFR